MSMKIGDKFLITTDGWFFAPDGESYRAVFGTVKAITDAEKELGVKTNERSTNWYVEIGNMIIAGCQIHYAIRTDKVSFAPPTREEGSSIGEVLQKPRWYLSRIYNADEEA